MKSSRAHACKIRNWLTVGLLCLTLTLGCQGSAGQTTRPVPSVPAASPSAVSSLPAEAPPDQPTALATAVLFSGALTEADAAAPSPSTPTSLPDPLRFVFPTPGQAPVSAWRPPLYPTPWAPTPYDHFYFARPIAADQVNWPVATYRYGGVFFDDVVHTGVDIPAPKGTPVLATGSGKVVWAGYGIYRGGYDVTDPYGLAVTIRHDFGYQGQTLYTIYGHLDRVDVAEGQHVASGDPLGLVGETGNVTGPHLHFEIRLGENSFFNTRNPELWLVPPQGWGVLAGRVTDSDGELLHGQLVTVHAPQSGQNWFARSYGPEAVNSDPYYQENLVVGDLPAGIYELRAAYAGFNHTYQVEIYPGLVSYFNFSGWDGFQGGLPPAPGVDFSPLVTQTVTP